MSGTVEKVTDGLLVPHEYQTRLFEIAKDRNTIVCLPTGSGKTYIAVMLIKHYQDELLDNFNDTDAKRTIFLVPTKPLVTQQAEYIRRHTDLEVGSYTGQSMINNKQIDFWSLEEWNEQFQKYKVLVMVHQLFLNLIDLHKFLNLDKVNLIIFDEAHHAGPNKKLKKVNHPYSQITDAINRSPYRPRILALSASLIKNNVKCDYIKKSVEMLEQALKSDCATITGIENLGGCGTHPEEVIWQYNSSTFVSNSVLDNILNGVVESIEGILEAKRRNGDAETDNSDDCMDDEMIISDIFGSYLPIPLRQLYRSLRWLREAFSEMGPWCLQSSLRYYRDYFNKTYELHKDSFPAFAEFLKVFIDLCTQCDLILSEMMKNMTEEEKLFDFVSPKMQRLLELLSNYKPHIKKLCGVVFVARRNECVEICRWLNAVAKYDEKNYGFLKVGYAVGVSSMPGFVSAFAKQDAKKQEEVLCQFREPENPGKNLLIATSVLEEGIDVPHCNLVARYSPPVTFRDYVQSKGRARAKNANYVLFCETGETKENITFFHNVDAELQRLCQRRGLLEERWDNIDDYTDHDKDVISKTGARITLNMSIQVVHMYCAKLPSDSFTMLRPIDRCQTNRDGYRHKYMVKMPINSEVPKVVVCSNESRIKAKKLAYLEVCRQLYEKGKLTDHFGPVKSEVLVKKHYEELNLPIGFGDEKVEIEEIEKDDGKTKIIIKKPGTRKKSSPYPRLVHESLKTMNVSSGCSNSFLYCIDMAPESAQGEAELILVTAKVGFVSFSALPIEETRVSSFPVFNRYGKINVTFKLVDEKLTLNCTQMKLLKAFHNYVFGQALHKSKDKLHLDTHNFEPEFFVVLLKDGEINWKELERVVKEFEEYNSFELTIEKRENEVDVKRREGFQYIPNKYVNSIVVPWYRDEVVYYKVVEAEPNLSPESPWINEEYASFKNYFFKRYGAQILLDEQCLLSVKGFERSFARISPIKKKINKKSTYPIYLVPELCITVPLNSMIFDLFLPLPAIFYRLNQLLVADEFRRYVDIHAFAKSLPQQQSSRCFSNKCDRLEKNDDDVYEEIDADGVNKIIELDDKIFSDEEAWWVSNDENIEEMDFTNDNWDLSFEEDLVGVEQGKHLNADEEYEKISANGSTSKKEIHEIVVKGVTDRNLDFNPEQIEPVGHTQSLQSVQFCKETFDSKRFVLEITERLQHTYDAISSEFVPASQWKDNDMSNVESENIKSTEMSLNLEVMKRVKSFDNSDDIREGPNANLILQALTSRRSMDVFNFERLEMIGDSFLKFSTALFMFCKYPELDVNALVLLKDKQVSNFNLFRLGKQLGIPSRMMFYAFDSSTRLSTFLEKESTQVIDDKSVADCMEALIGAYLLRLGPQGAIVFMKWLGLNVTNIEGVSLQDKHWIECKIRGTSQFAEDDEGSVLKKVDELYKRGRMNKFEEILDYEFKDRSHLVKALTHSSYYHNTVTGCYQRYEFLGDAIIDYLITRHIYADDQEFNPGELTDLRQSLVHNAFFGCLAVKYKFHKYLKHLSPEIFSVINKFDTKFSENENEYIYGSFYLVTEDDTELSEEVEIPKILGDIFESVAAAIYIDSGFSLDTVWNVYYKFLERALINNSKHVPKAPTRQLFESDGETKIHPAEVNQKDNVVSVKVETHGQIFEGFGKNKHYARMSAARKALKALKRQNKLKIRSKPRSVDI